MIKNGDLLVYTLSGCKEIVLVIDAANNIGLDTMGGKEPFVLAQNIHLKSVKRLEILHKGTDQWDSAWKEFKELADSWKVQVTQELAALDLAINLYGPEEA